MISDEELFDGAEPPKQEETAKEEPTKAKEEPTGEKQEADESVEAKAETPEPEEPSPGSDDHVPLKALHGERDRRKAAENRAKELEEQIASQTKPDPTSVFEDEQKFRDEFKNEIRAELVQERLVLSEKFARKLHGDETVDAAIDWFAVAAKDSPLLAEKFRESGNDVDTIVSLHNSHQEAKKLEDIDAYKAELKAEAKAEALKELKAEQDAKAKLRNSIPDSLTDDPSSGGIRSDAFTEPTDEELFDGA